MNKIIKSQDKEYFLYELIDPRDNSCKYIGISNNLQARSETHKYSKNKELSLWITTLKKINKKPNMKIIKKGNYKKMLKEEEKRIKIKSKSGNILNTIHNQKNKIKIEKERIHIILNDKVEKKMREKKVRKKGDISKYIESLIKEDLKIK